MKNINRQISFLGIFLISLILFTVTAFAIGKPQDVGAQGQGLEHPNVSVTQGVGGKLRACQARESAIKNRLTHLTTLTTNMETKFDAIAARVENFYTNKVVPSGKTVSNYNTLVSDIQAQKTTVQTVLTKAQTDVNSFSCISGNPKTQLTQLREDMQVVKRALKAYRTSIKNLIVAVRSVTGGTERNSAETPKPTK